MKNADPPGAGSVGQRIAAPGAGFGCAHPDDESFGLGANWQRSPAQEPAAGSGRPTARGNREGRDRVRRGSARPARTGRVLAGPGRRSSPGRAPAACDPTGPRAGLVCAVDIPAVHRDEQHLLGADRADAGSVGARRGRRLPGFRVVDRGQLLELVPDARLGQQPTGSIGGPVGERDYAQPVPVQEAHPAWRLG